MAAEDEERDGEGAGVRGPHPEGARATTLETPAETGGDALGSSGVNISDREEPENDGLEDGRGGETLGVAQTMESDDGRGPAASGQRSRPTIPRGTMLDDVYRVEDCIGRGAMGAVYTVEHTALGKRFAAKVLAQTQTTDEEAVRRLQQEARAASAIDHENIVSVTHLGKTSEGVFFVVMELLKGEDLGARLDRLRVGDGGPVPDAETRDVVAQILTGLAAAHGAGIVHRDLKPENVFLARRGSRIRPKIVDFGISKLSSDGAKVRLTQTGQLLGTPLYMAPEQTRGESREVDGRADLYSLGIIAYEMVTGRHPFPSETIYEILMKHANEDPPPPRLYRGDLPEGIEQVILTAMAKQPDDRFPNAEAMLAAWHAAWDGHLPTSVPPGEDSGEWSNPGFVPPSRPSGDGSTNAPTERPPSARVGPGRMAALLLLVVGVAGGIAYLVGRGSGPPTPSAEALPPPPAAAPEVVPEPVPEPSAEPEPAPAPAPVPSVIQVTSAPVGATVLDGDDELGLTPLEVSVEPGGSRGLTLRLDGHVDAEVTVEADGGDRVEVTLRKRRIRKPPPLAPSRYR